VAPTATAPRWNEVADGALNHLSLSEAGRPILEAPFQRPS
jgi:hypothetical protein